MLSYAKLPKHFWDEALYTAMHIINLTPIVILDSEVPNKIWFGQNVSYDHLHVFGCKTFFHIPSDERSKLDAKTRQCIFIGYGEDEFCYKFYDPVEKKLVRSCDVQFMKDQTIEDINKVERTTPGKDSNVTDGNPMRLPSYNLENVEKEAQYDQQHGDVDDQQVGSGVEVPTDHAQEAHDDDLGDIPEPPQVQLRRCNRHKQPSTRYSCDEYITLTVSGKPECFEEALESEEKQKWLDTMQDGMKSLHDNHTYDLVKLPKGRRALENKWIFKVKQDANSTFPKYKARLVVKGFRQKKGVDFNEIFSHVVKMSSIRTLLSLAATLDLEVQQMDVKLTFLHRNLEEEIYMKQPSGFLVEGKEDYECRLRKSPYSLKQALRQWYKKFESFMCEQGYKKTTYDHCVFIKSFFDDDFIILLLYVDDMLIVGKDVSKINRLKKQLGESFAMKDLGVGKQILRIRIIREIKEKKLWLSQERYIKRMFQGFQMENAKAVSTPLATHFKLSVKQSPSNEAEKAYMSRVPYAYALGSFMYAMVCTRLDNDALDAKLLALEKVHTNDNGADMMTKALPREKFEVCYEIVGLAVISTQL